MFEKVNPQHPDKVADRIAGAIVDLAYAKSENPKVAAEVLLGHGQCSLQIETSERLTAEELEAIVHRIAGEEVEVRALIVPQDVHLADNQAGAVRSKTFERSRQTGSGVSLRADTTPFRCGDNGIFKGVPPTKEQKLLTSLAHTLYNRFPTDGKYMCGPMILNPGSEYQAEVYGVTICQSHATEEQIDECMTEWEQANFGEMKDYPFEASCINPLGPWTGGTDVDCGATNRKLGSDMGDGVTGGGLHGKDLSKADVSVNIWCYLESIRTGREVTACCSIGDETVNGIPYRDIVEQARLYIHTLGGFERFAEWGLIRHKDY